MKEDRKLVQVIFKKGLYFSRTEYKEDGKTLMEIYEYDALAVYQTEDSSYGSILVLPVPLMFDNCGYSIPDKYFCSFANNCNINQVVTDVRVKFLNGGDLENALYLTMLTIHPYTEFTYMYVQREYIRRYGMEEDEEI